MFPSFNCIPFVRCGVLAGGVLLAGGGLWADPIGDYGDAPDDPLHIFPTRFATPNSRLGGPGAHHTSTGLEILGVGVSNEDGALDAGDPDGITNLVDGDSDDGLLGVTFRNAGNPFPATGVTRAGMDITVQISVAPSAPATTRVLNVLVDTNRDQEWRNTAGGQEWVVVNLPILTAPGTSEVLTIPLDVVSTGGPTPAADMWMRLTLTRTEIDEASTTGAGGWDGSGAFDYGETEDYIIFSSAAPGTPIPPLPPPPPFGCSCAWKLRCKPQVLVVPHGVAGTVTMEATVRGDPGCTLNLEGIVIDQIGPMFGLGVVNGVDPADIGAPVPPPGVVGAGPGKYLITVPFGSDLDGPCRIQSFGIKYRVSGTCGGSKVFAGTKTCGVLVVHNCGNQFWGVLDFGPSSGLPLGTPLEVNSTHGFTTPTAKVAFQQMQTSGSLHVFQVANEPPVLVTSGPATLDRMSFFDIFYELPDPTLPEPPAEIQTEIIAMELTGWTPIELAGKGIADENDLRLGKMPLFPDPFFDPFTEISPDVGVNQIVDTVNHRIQVGQPYGFSYWTIGGVGSPAVPVKLSNFELD